MIFFISRIGLYVGSIVGKEERQTSGKLRRNPFVGWFLCHHLHHCIPGKNLNAFTLKWIPFQIKCCHLVLFVIIILNSPHKHNLRPTEVVSGEQPFSSTNQLYVYVYMHHIIPENLQISGHNLAISRRLGSQITNNWSVVSACTSNVMSELKTIDIFALTHWLYELLQRHWEDRVGDRHKSLLRKIPLVRCAN